MGKNKKKNSDSQVNNETGFIPTSVNSEILIEKTIQDPNNKDSSEKFTSKLDINSIEFFREISIAIIDGQISPIKKFLDEDNNVNHEFTRGLRLIFLATTYGKPEIVKFLLENKADPNAENSKRYRPIHLAVGRGNSEIVELLLNAKADPIAADHKGRTPLKIAIEYSKINSENKNFYNIVKLLVSHSVKLDNNDIKWARTISDNYCKELLAAIPRKSAISPEKILDNKDSAIQK